LRPWRWTCTRVSPLAGLAAVATGILLAVSLERRRAIATG
jgi:hypothetical protein